MICFLFRKKLFVMCFSKTEDILLMKRSQIMNVFDLYEFELLKFAVHTSRESHPPNMKILYIHGILPVFTRRVCFNTFHVPEVRQSLKYRGTLSLNYLIKTKILPRNNYESISGIETRKVILNIEIINCERLADVVLCC